MMQKVSLVLATVLSASVGFCFATDAAQPQEIVQQPAEKYDWKKVTFEPKGAGKEGQVILSVRAHLPNKHADRHQLAALANQAIAETLSRLFNKQQISAEYTRQFGRLQTAVRIKKDKLTHKKDTQNLYEPGNMLEWLSDVMTMMQQGIENPESPLQHAIHEENSSLHRAHESIQRWTFDRSRLEPHFRPYLPLQPATHTVIDSIKPQLHEDRSDSLTTASVSSTASVSTHVTTDKKINYAVIRNWVLGVTGGVLLLDILIRRKKSVLFKIGKATGKVGTVMWRWLFGAPQPEAATDELTAEECAELAGALIAENDLEADDNPA